MNRPEHPRTDSPDAASRVVLPRLAELAFAAWLVAKGMAPRTTPSEAQVVASGA